MKYFAIFDKNVVTIFQLQLNIGDIPEIFLQYCELCGLLRGCTGGRAMYRELNKN